MMEVYVVDVAQRCVFCLNKLPFPNVVNDGDNNLKKLNSISCKHLWGYFIDEWRGLGQIKFKGLNGTSSEEEIPPLCGRCKGKVTELDKLHRELNDKVKEIKEIIVKRSVVDWEELRAESTVGSTIRFLEELRNGACKASGIGETCSESNNSLEVEPCGNHNQPMHDDEHFGPEFIPDNIAVKVEPDEDNPFEFEPSWDAGDEMEVDVKEESKSPRGRPPGVKSTRNRRRKRTIISAEKKKRGPQSIKTYRCDMCYDRIIYTGLVEHLRGHVKD